MRIKEALKLPKFRHESLAELATIRLLHFACKQDITALEYDLERIRAGRLLTLPVQLEYAAEVYKLWIIHRACPATPHIRRKELEKLNIERLSKSNIPKLIGAKQLTMTEKTPETLGYFARYLHADPTVHLEILKRLVKKMVDAGEISVS